MSNFKLFPPGRAFMCIEVAGQRYIPSNGTEGMAFVDGWCSHCARDKAVREGEPIEECNDNELCPIIARSMADGGCPEWVYGTDGQPRCTKFVEHGQSIPYRCPATIDMLGEQS